MKLIIELVPSTSWYSNVRSQVNKETWDIIRKTCYKKAGYKCEVCSGKGPKWPVECHEIWEYDDVKHIQLLKGFIALCPDCHSVKHIGYAQVSGNYLRAIEQLKKVNNISNKEAYKYVDKCFKMWNKRSKYEWTINTLLITRYIIIKN